MTTSHSFECSFLLKRLPPAIALSAIFAIIASPLLAQTSTPALPSVEPVAKLAAASREDVIRVQLNAAEVAFRAKDWQKAVESYTQVLAIDPKHARAARWRGTAYGELGQYDLAVQDWQTVVDRAPNYIDGLNSLCWTLLLVDQASKAQASCSKAQQLYPLDLSANLNLAHIYLLQGNKLEAWRWYEQTIGLTEHASNLKNGMFEAFDFFEKRGWQQEIVKQTRAEFEPKFSRWLQAKPALDELLKQANLADESKDTTKSIALREQMIAGLIKVMPETNPRVVSENLILAARLSAEGSRLRSADQYANAQALYAQALAISEKIEGSEHPSTGKILNNLALLYKDLGQYDKAEPLLLRALVISEKAQGAEHPDIGTSLNNLAELYRALGQYAKAEPLYLRALAISEKAQGPEHPSTGLVLSNIAVVLSELSQNARAELLHLRALAIFEKALGAEHPNTGSSLNLLADLYQELDQYTKAEPLSLRALNIAIKAKHPMEQSIAGKSLMTLHAPKTPATDFPRNPALAIWYGKQSVNALQAIRDNIKSLDKESQQSFLKQNQSTYEYLADLLIEAGRLAESEQVLSMLKEQELKELTRRSGPAPSQVAFTGPEVAFAKTQASLSQAAVATYSELEALRTRKRQGYDWSAAETARAADLEAQSALHKKAFQDFMAQLQKGLSVDPVSAQRERDSLEKSSRGMQTLLRQAGSGHVGLHYVVTDERLSVIVSLPGASFAKQSNVSRAELNRHIGQLRQALQTPALDPRPPAQALYKLLIEPIAPDLAQAKAHTLVLSLTDLLRYIPFGALHDGQQYLAQSYAVSLYTPAGGQGIQKTISKDWQIAGLGLTQAATIADDNNRKFDALPGVGKELASIVRTSASPKGALPGQISLDPLFTKARFEQALPKFPVLHVASHFQFTPGSEYLSYLVMGDGTRLSLADLKDLDFTGVQLLTLSACDTASGGGRNERGSEVEGLGAAVQLAGAKAVLATLWPVADESTAVLMQRFYELRSKDTASTAVAIQQAQLEMLQGKGAAGAAGPDVARGAAAVKNTAEPTPAAGLPKLRPYMADPDKPFAHPYFWAPFILMGNWL
jgi:CHAT domain-containing protein/Tfp pilus assembly protein PilF